MVRLTDKSVIPDDELIFSLIGDKKMLWKWIMEHVAKIDDRSAGTWKWYNDGKQWLYRLADKKKTIFWADLTDDTFRITFWFGDKAAPLVEEAPLPPSIKDEFKKTRKIGNVRPVSVVVHEQIDADNVITLVSIKKMLK
jgi:hypothetical protein